MIRTTPAPTEPAARAAARAEAVSPLLQFQPRCSSPRTIHDGWEVNKDSPIAGIARTVPSSLSSRDREAILTRAQERAGSGRPRRRCATGRPGSSRELLHRPARHEPAGSARTRRRPCLLRAPVPVGACSAGAPGGVDGVVRHAEVAGGAVVGPPPPVRGRALHRSLVPRILTVDEPAPLSPWLPFRAEDLGSAAAFVALLLGCIRPRSRPQLRNHRQSCRAELFQHHAGRDSHAG